MLRKAVNNANETLLCVASNKKLVYVGGSKEKNEISDSEIIKGSVKTICFKIVFRGFKMRTRRRRRIVYQET
jgi:hypothetical protein